MTRQVYQTVADMLSDQGSKEIWNPLSRELLEAEDGPGVFRSQLDAELKQFEERVKRETKAVSPQEGR